MEDRYRAAMAEVLRRPVRGERTYLVDVTIDGRPMGQHEVTWRLGIRAASRKFHAMMVRRHGGGVEIELDVRVLEGMA